MRNVLCTTWFAFVLVLAGGVKGEPGSPPYNPSDLPEPRVSLPAMPGDGSGVYRISLDGVFKHTTLTVLVDLRDGKPLAGVALPLQIQRCGWWPMVSNELVYADGVLKGSMVFDCMPLPGRENTKYLKYKPIDEALDPKYVPFVFEPVARAVVTLDLACDGNFGRGSATLTMQGRLHGLGIKAGETLSSAAYLVREPHAELPGDYQFSLELPRVLANAGIVNPRNSVTGGAAVHFFRSGVQDASVQRPAIHYGKCLAPMVIADPDLKASDGRIHGTVDVAYPEYADQTVTLQLDTDIRIGRMICGRVTCIRGDFRETQPWVGVVQALRDTDLPIELPAETAWEWNDELAPDAAMSTQALQEASLPVMPGVPGEADFWTWRSLVRHGNKVVSCIHPPSFALLEVEGARTYRVDIAARKGSPLNLSFELEKPWHSFTEIWPSLPVGNKPYAVTVTPLDKDGKAIAAPMQMSIMGSDGKPAVRTMNPGDIQIVKRPHFSGPQSLVERSWLDAALRLGRTLRDMPRKPEGRGTGMATSVGAWNKGHSDHGFATQWAAALWGTLARRALTADPAERQWSEDVVHLHLADLVAHLGGKPRVPYDYQHQTPLAHWAVEAMCDAWIQTGNPDFKEQAMLAAQGICDLQVPDGSFASDIGAGYKYGKTTKPREEWYGSCKKLKHYPTFATPELLYALGRVRRDMGTDRFAEAETKAYEWAMENCVKGRFWPLHVCHSASQGYPNLMHPSTAFFFCRYLLECAPEDRRDVELAEAIARWGEDYLVDWGRGYPGPGGIFPRIPSRDRYNNTPIVNNMLAAIVFEELAQATGDDLWAAKGDALARAAVQCIGPKGQVVTVPDFVTRGAGWVSGHDGFSLGWAAQLLREYDALVAERKEQ